MCSITAEYDSKVYEKTVLMKAAYSFIDKFYIHFAVKDNSNYVVTFTPKMEESGDNIVERFENELLAQSVRQYVYRETHSLREILVARAMSSSMIMDDSIKEDDVEVIDHTPENFDLNDILSDWFKHEEHI